MKLIAATLKEAVGSDKISNTEIMLVFLAVIREFSKNDPEQSAVFSQIPAFIAYGLDKLVPGSVTGSSDLESLHVSWLERFGHSAQAARIMNDARNIHQQQYVKFEVIENAREEWRPLSPSEAAFHSIGYDPTTIRKYVHVSDGREFVFIVQEDGPPVFVSDGINTGTYNYADDKIGHILLDVLPWVMWGIGPSDTSSREDRMNLSFESISPWIADVVEDKINTLKNLSAKTVEAAVNRLVSGSQTTIAAIDNAAGPIASLLEKATSPNLVTLQTTEAFPKDVSPQQPVASDGFLPLSDSVPESAAPASANDGFDRWGPTIVPDRSIRLGYRPCGDRPDVRTCLGEMGLSEDAIDFSLAIGGDTPGEVFAFEFKELGSVDLAVVEFTGASAYYYPVLINGPLGYRAISAATDLHTSFVDTESRELLRLRPKAQNWYGNIIAHRQLAVGTQRFVYSETLTDFCRACQILGVSIEFLEIGPSTGGVLKRRPIGLDHRPQGYEVTEELVMTFAPALQSMLNMRGYEAGPMDGYPGPQTRTALMEFQVEHCLPPTGQPDPTTAKALFNTNGFEAPCADDPITEGISANSPLLAGMYVDDLSLCSLESLPFETAHLRQRIIRGNRITWGQEGACEAARTDIREGITLFRGTCSEGNATGQNQWRFDVLSNESFVDLDMPTSASPVSPSTFFRCPADSLLRQAWAAWFDDDRATQSREDRAKSRPLSDPELGTELRTEILNAIRPFAVDAYGAPVQFVVNTIRAGDDPAYASLSALRPGGEAINITRTPAFQRREVGLASGDPDLIEALLRRDDSGWKVIRHVLGPSEAWWLDDCRSWGALFPETCEADGSAHTDVATALVLDQMGDQGGASVPQAAVDALLQPVLSGDTDLDAFIARNLPSWLIAATVDYRIFPQGDGGRISVAGTLKLTEPLVVPVSGWPELWNEGFRRGLLNSEYLMWAMQKRYGSFSDRGTASQLVEHGVSVPAGSEIEFTAELSYIETVREKKVSGLLHYDPGPGVPLSTLQGDFYLPGTPRFEAIAVETLPIAITYQRNAAASIDAVLSKIGEGLLVGARDGTRYFDVSFPHSALDNPAAQVKRDRTKNGNHPMALALDLPTTTVAQTEINYSNPIRIGDRLPAFLRVNLNPEVVGLESVTLTLMVENAPNSYQIHSGVLAWDASVGSSGAFVGGYYGNQASVGWPK